MLKIFPHVLITRYGIGVTNADWYAYKINLFRSITLPSISCQAREKFFWTIVIDADIPSQSLAELRDAVDAYPFIHLVTLEVGSQPRLVHGGFPDVYEHCQQYLLAHGLIEDPTEYVITSLIDDDDAWNMKVVDRIDRIVDDHSARLCATEAETSRGFLIRHSVGMFMTFANGIVWDVASDRFEQVKAPSHSMSIFIFSRFSSNVAACSVRHGSWHSYTTCVGFEVHVVDQEDPEPQPMWVYIRHPRAISQIPGPSVGSPVNAAALHSFRELFSIDVDSFMKYRDSIRAREEQHSGVPDDSKFDLLDLQFRISAYRRQIECLSTALVSTQTRTTSSDEFARLRCLKHEATDRLAELKDRFRSISQR
jgi:hypothetical protein